MAVCLAAMAVCLATQSATAVRLAAIARTSDGNKPRETSEASIAHNERLSGMASPRDLFPPTEKLTDAELALAARRSRLRREAVEAAMKVSAAALVRERFSGPTRTMTEHGTESEEASKVTKKRSAARNTQRLMAANTSDAVVIGESTSNGACSSYIGGSEEVSFLSVDAKSFLLGPLQGPDDSFEPSA